MLLRVEVHPNIAQVVALDDKDVDRLTVIYELADEGDFASYAWGHASTSMSMLMR